MVICTETARPASQHCQSVGRSMLPGKNHALQIGNVRILKSSGADGMGGSRNDGTEQFEREKTQRNMKLNKEVWSHEQPQQNQNPFSLLHLITSLMFSQVCFKDTYVCY